MKPRTTGQALMKAIMEIAPLYGLWLERRNTGVARYAGKDGRDRFTRYSEKGTADLSGIVLANGRYIEIEAKATGELPTVDQGERILKINRLGGIAFWCDQLIIAESFLAAIIDYPKGKFCYRTAHHCTLCTFDHPETLAYWPAPPKRPNRRRSAS